MNMQNRYIIGQSFRAGCNLSEIMRLNYYHSTLDVAVAVAVIRDVG